MYRNFEGFVDKCSIKRNTVKPKHWPINNHLKSYNNFTWVPILPSLLTTYRPTNPVHPNTVHTIPLKLLRPPVPRL